MPFFVEGLDLHAKCSTTIAITECSFKESHAYHAQSHSSPHDTKESAETGVCTVNKMDISHMWRV